MKKKANLGSLSWPRGRDGWCKRRDSVQEQNTLLHIRANSAAFQNLVEEHFWEEKTEWCQRPEEVREVGGPLKGLGNISNLFLFYVWGWVLRGVGWIPVGLSGDAAIINRQSEGRASVHKGIAESSEIIGADFSPEGEDYLCSPVVRK